MKRKHPCPCCGYLTLDEKPPGTFDICSVCFWEDDNIQFYDPNFSGGANKMSLNEAKDNFSKYGAKSPEHLKYVRKPLDEEKPDTEQWNG